MKLVHITKVNSIEPHPNADRLDIIRILGGVRCISEKGRFEVGEEIIYIPVDAQLVGPIRECFRFLREEDEKPFRIKIVRLRGIASEGILLKRSELPEFLDEEYAPALLGVEKYIKPVVGSNIDYNGNFPVATVSKTDEDNGKTCPEVIDRIIKEYGNDITFQITLKADGTSCTVVFEDGEIASVCSRNQTLKEADNNYWRAAHELKRILRDKNFTGVIQGELVGPNIQKNPMKLHNVELYIFNAYIGKDLLDSRDLNDFFDIYSSTMIREVYELEQVRYINVAAQVIVDSLSIIANETLYTENAPAEGIVVRPIPLKLDPYTRRPYGFKIINTNYKDS